MMLVASPPPPSLGRRRSSSLPLGPANRTPLWEDESVDYSTLVAQNNSLDNPDVDAFAGSLTTAIAWDYEREPNVGSLVSITEPASGVDRWRTLDSSGSTTMQRDDGHRLDLVEVDSASYQIDHDDAGALEFEPYEKHPLAISPPQPLRPRKRHSVDSPSA